jgi:hypothetical protein
MEEKLKASRAASPRRNEGVTGNENRGYLSSSSSSSSSEIEYEDDDDDEDETSRQLEVMDELSLIHFHHQLRGGTPPPSLCAFLNPEPFASRFLPHPHWSL